MPPVHDDQTVAGTGDLLHGVGNHEDGGVLGVAVVADILQDRLTAGCVQAGRRLVEDQDLRLHGDHARDGNAALLTAGEVEG